MLLQASEIFRKLEVIKCGTEYGIVALIVVEALKPLKAAELETREAMAKRLLLKKKKIQEETDAKRKALEEEKEQMDKLPLLERQKQVEKNKRANALVTIMKNLKADTVSLEQRARRCITKHWWGNLMADIQAASEHNCDVEEAGTIYFYTPKLEKQWSWIAPNTALVEDSKAHLAQLLSNAVERFRQQTGRGPEEPEMVVIRKMASFQP